jgi:hypothetical protein
MIQHGVDTQTGDIWFDESTAPIRPLMSLQEFMEAFESLGVARVDVAMNPFPQCVFDRTICIGGQLFCISTQFSDSRSAHSPDLQMIRLFAKRSAWKRKQTGILLALRRFLSSKPLMVGLPQGYDSMEEQLSIYESWLSRTVGQTTHKQSYVWGHLNLVNSQDDCYFLQFDFLDSSSNPPSREIASA